MGSIGTSNDLENTPAPGVPFYTPAQIPPAGTPLDKASAPTLFQPLRIRDLELHNRIVVSPMCQYSADNGHLTDYHLVHLGQLALHGPGLIFVEATAVEPRGRISPQDSGLWQDSQIAPLRRVTDFIHSQGVKAAIQLAHAGRKASTLAPWIGGTANKTVAPESAGGWPNDVVGPSAIPFYEDHAQPKELTIQEIKGLVQKFAESAKRAVEAGFDVIEIHGAHGYLINEFLSPLSNVSLYLSMAIIEEKLQ
jgi:2,4-dienoyl-CoA reductase-like NADH-dependent reductase (Old Yellow Enzyme family)